jgi:hypothetical protein
MTRVTFNTGEMGLFPRHMEVWVGATDQGRLVLNLSKEALMAACDGTNAEVELRPKCRLVDARVSSLVAAVNDRYAVRRPLVPRYRGGLAPARLRRALRAAD